MNNKFDQLTKSVAQSVTRRQALRRFGLGLAGMALAGFALSSKADFGNGEGGGEGGKPGKFSNNGNGNAGTCLPFGSPCDNPNSCETHCCDGGGFCDTNPTTGVTTCVCS